MQFDNENVCVCVCLYVYVCVCSRENCLAPDKPHSQMECCEPSLAGIEISMMMVKVAWDHLNIWSLVEQKLQSTLAPKMCMCSLERRLTLYRSHPQMECNEATCAGIVNSMIMIMVA